MSLTQILASYERARQQEQEALVARRAKARALHPGFDAIEQSRRGVLAALTANIRNGSPAGEAAAAAREALLALKLEEDELLLALKLPADYLTLHVRCARCGDTGYAGGAARQPCTCLQKALLESERASSRINDEETFERFNPDVYPSEAQRKQMLAARRVAEEYADTIPQSKLQNLMLMGMPGLGKTFLLNSIAARVLERGYSVEKVTAYTMQERILKGIRTGTDGAAPFLKAPLLLIDDLGTEPMMKNITLEYLFTLLNERRNDHKHTVAASNLSLEQLQEKYGERVFSRLISSDKGGILHLRGENLRLDRKAAQ